jgi:hypothetical protein
VFFSRSVTFCSFSRGKFPYWVEEALVNIKYSIKTQEITDDDSK